MSDRYRNARPVTVVSTVLRFGHERLADAIGREHRRVSGPAVHECGLDRGADIALGGHVHDGVVHEHRVERAAEPYRAHLALPMLAVGIERGADGEHAGRRVDL